MKSQSILILLIAIALLASTTVAIAIGDCSDYVDLTGAALPISVYGTTEGASADYTPFDPSSERPDCWEGPLDWSWARAMGPDRTYKWTAPGLGWYAISLVGSDYAADLLLYDFTCPEEPQYPDDFICGSHSMFQGDGLVTDLLLAAGQELLIVVDGYGQETGNYELKILDTNQLDDYVPFLMDTLHLPGLSATLIKDGVLFWSGEYGDASLEDESASAVTDSTLFVTMCACKPITGTALMQFWEDGSIDLDADVSGYLDFELYHPDYPDIPITTRMLMCNVSGIAENYPAGLTFYDEDSPVSLADFMYDYFAPDGAYYNPNLNFTDDAPGTTYHYSTMGITLLGYLVECLASDPATTFVDHCREQLFDPLGMDRSSFMLSDIIDVQHLALPYRWSGSDFDVPSDGHPHVPWYPSQMLRTSAEEMTRFLMAIMRGGELEGEQIVAPATVDTMLTIQFPEIEIPDSPGGPAGHDQGLVWKQIDFDGREVWGALGDGWGQASATMFFSPSENSGVVILANSGKDYDDDICTGTRFLTDAFLDFIERNEGVGVTDQVTPTPQRVHLNPCYPNPFNPQTTITFALDQRQHAEVSVFDLTGRQLAMLADRIYSAGNHSIVWNGKDATGRALPSGTYVVRLDTESGVEARKVMLVR